MGVVMNASFAVPNWKDQESTGKDSQGGLPLIGEVPTIASADPSFIGRSSWEGACRYAAQRCGMDDYEIADEIGISHGYICKVLKGTAGLYGRRLIKFMRATRSLAPLQWLADQMGCDVVLRSSQAAEIARLRRELAEAERGGRVAA
jgi:hypothetical protein